MDQQSRSKLIVNYLPQSFKDDDLRKLFAGYGTIVDCKIARDRERMSLGYGFVELIDQSSAANCILRLQNYTKQLRLIILGHHQQRYKM